MMPPNPDQTAARIRTIIHRYRLQLDAFETVYKDVHRSPEVSLQEKTAASRAANHLKSLGCYVREKISSHGVVGILKNGPGRTVLLTAELDALPVLEKTGVLFDSKIRMPDGTTKPVMHACGHDMHMICLMGAATLLYEARKKWAGSLVLVFSRMKSVQVGHKGWLTMDSTRGETFLSLTFSSVNTW
jgi:metal-dependent amidase/aminoacylase/carboxypeptidase family protein